MILNPYETTYGKVIYNKNDIEKVKEYLKNNADSLRYEFFGTSHYDTFLPAFIIGKDSLEQNLPLFNQPIIYELSFDIGWAASDLRKFISKNVLRNDVNNIYNSGYITNRAGLDVEIIKTLLSCEVANEKGLSELKKSFNTIAMAYAITISNLLRIKLNYGANELLAVRIACVYFILMLFGTTKDKDSFRKTIYDRMLHFNFGAGIMLDARTKMSYFNNLTSTGDDINSLIESINTMLKFVSYPVTINTGILLQTVSEFFRGGANASENIMIGLEYMPNFIALVYSSFTEKSYKNTGLTKILDSNKKIIQPEYLINDIKYILDKYTTTRALPG